MHGRRLVEKVPKSSSAKTDLSMLMPSMQSAFRSPGRRARIRGRLLGHSRFHWVLPHLRAKIEVFEGRDANGAKSSKTRIVRVEIKEGLFKKNEK